MGSPWPRTNWLEITVREELIVFSHDIKRLFSKGKEQRRIIINRRKHSEHMKRGETNY